MDPQTPDVNDGNLASNTSAAHVDGDKPVQHRNHADGGSNSAVNNSTSPSTGSPSSSSIAEPCCSSMAHQDEPSQSCDAPGAGGRRTPDDTPSSGGRSGMPAAPPRPPTPTPDVNSMSLNLNMCAANIQQMLHSASSVPPPSSVAVSDSGSRFLFNIRV